MPRYEASATIRIVLNCKDSCLSCRGTTHLACHAKKHAGVECRVLCVPMSVSKTPTPPAINFLNSFVGMRYLGWENSGIRTPTKHNIPSNYDSSTINCNAERIF